jgi:hypothetical protein
MKEEMASKHADDVLNCGLSPLFPALSPRFQVVQLDDTEPGCPQTGRSSRLLSASFTTATSKSLLIGAGHMIRNSVGRSQLQLSVDDTVFDRALVFTPIQDWVRLFSVSSALLALFVFTIAFLLIFLLLGGRGNSWT